MLMKDFQILYCHPGNDDIMLTDKHTKTDHEKLKKVSHARVSQTPSFCASPFYHPDSPSPLAKPHCRFCLLWLFTLGEWAESHQYTRQPSCSAVLHCFLSLQTAVIVFCKLPFLFPYTHIVDQLLLAFFYCIFLLQISISMDWRGLLSKKSGYWCFSAVEKLPQLKKIGTHAPDEPSQDKSQHETYQASLLRRRQIMKQTQRKQYRCNLLYIRTSESVLELIWLWTTTVSEA